MHFPDCQLNRVGEIESGRETEELNEDVMLWRAIYILIDIYFAYVIYSVCF